MALSLLHQFKRLADCQNKFVLEYYPLRGDSAESTKASKKLHEVIDPVNKVRSQVQTAVSNLPPTTTITKNGGATTTTTTPADVTKIGLYLVFSDLNTQYDQWIGALITAISQNQASAQFTPGPNVGVTSLLQGAELEEELAKPGTYILFANVGVAGGTQRDRKAFLLSIFAGDFITYSGGLIANFGLMKAARDSNVSPVIMADVLRYRTPNSRFHGVHQSRHVESTNSADNIYSLCSHEKQGRWPGGADSSPSCDLLKALPVGVPAAGSH
jgi:hypothetical protein